MSRLWWSFMVFDLNNTSCRWPIYSPHYSSICLLITYLLRLLISSYCCLYHNHHNFHHKTTWRKPFASSDITSSFSSFYFFIRYWKIGNQNNMNNGNPMKFSASFIYLLLFFSFALVNGNTEPRLTWYCIKSFRNGDVKMESDREWCEIDGQEGR